MFTATYRLPSLSLFFMIVIAAFLTPVNAAAEEGFITTPDGAKLYYQKVGTGKPSVIVPLHLFLYEPFKNIGKTIVFYDVRNRGRSSRVEDTSTITLPQDVRDLETVRQHFGVKKVSLIGYSYAGMMVMLYTLEHPEYVDRVVQLGPVGMKWDKEYPPDESNSDDNSVIDVAAWNELQELKKKGWDKEHPREFCEKEWKVMRVRLVGDPAKAAGMTASNCQFENEWPTNLQRHFGAHFESIKKLNISRVSVAKVSQPVLTIHGRKDHNAPYGAGKEWASLLPNGRLITLPNAAHNSWVDEPRVAEMVQIFLAGSWPKQAEKPPRRVAFGRACPKLILL
jgi:proline iminopeptidase